jgi:HTH-type transcriptional repressor of NAD biosynthesis genes
MTMPFGKKHRGVTIGRFMPLHKGHELMIEMAANELEELVVIVSDEYGAELPSKMPNVHERFELIKRKYAGYDNIRVVKHVDSYGPAEAYDEFGTAVDDIFWDHWKRVFSYLAPEATYVVSSDRYGGVMAEKLGIKRFPVDPDRELFNVSGTSIRKDPIKNWKYISREFRPFFAKKIVVIGAESSGKSTLVRDLAEYFNSPAVPEYGRILSEAKPDLDDDDFYAIVRRHEFMTEKAAMETETGLVFVDTEKTVTFLYGIEYLKKRLDAITDFIGPDEFDLWVLVPPILSWIDDGTRIQSEPSQRQEFYICLDNYTAPKFGYNRMILYETDRKKRVEQVSAEVMKLLPTEDFSETYNQVLTSKAPYLTVN